MNYSTNSKLLQETKEEDTDFTFTIDESKYFYNIFDSQKGICKLYPKFELQYAASVNKQDGYNNFSKNLSIAFPICNKYDIYCLKFTFSLF